MTQVKHAVQELGMVLAIALATAMIAAGLTHRGSVACQHSIAVSAAHAASKP